MDNKPEFENEKKKNGMFLGIVGIATLIVAIIGASFAYFSIQASSDEGAINLTAYEFDASLSITQIYGPGDEGIIPVDPIKVVTGSTGNLGNLEFALNVREQCEDDNGYGVCALYSVTLERTANLTETATFNGKIITNENTASEKAGAQPFSNLQYRAVTGEDDGGSIYYTVGGTAIDLPTAVDGEVSIGDVTFAANEASKTFYFVIYLNEKKAENEETHEMEPQDQSEEMGATYKGQVVFTEQGSANTLTGTFTVS